MDSYPGSEKEQKSCDRTYYIINNIIYYFRDSTFTCLILLLYLNEQTHYFYMPIRTHRMYNVDDKYATLHKTVINFSIVWNYIVINYF